MGEGTERFAWLYLKKKKHIGDQLLKAPFIGELVADPR